MSNFSIDMNSLYLEFAIRNIVSLDSVLGNVKNSDATTGGGVSVAG